MGDYSEETKMILDDMLLAIPGVQSARMFGYPGHKINGKTFAFVCGDGFAVKLTAERAQALIADEAHAGPFEPAAGKIWAAWVLIEHVNSEDYRAEQHLFDESIKYVSQT